MWNNTNKFALAPTVAFFFFHEFNSLWQYKKKQKGFPNSGPSQNKHFPFIPQHVLTLQTIKFSSGTKPKWYRNCKISLLRYMTLTEHRIIDIRYIEKYQYDAILKFSSLHLSNICQKYETCYNNLQCFTQKNHDTYHKARSNEELRIYIDYLRLINVHLKLSPWVLLAFHFHQNAAAMARNKICVLELSSTTLYVLCYHSRSHKAC